MFAPWKKSYDQPRQHIKKQRHCFANKGPFSQSYDFFPLVMYGCESWTIKKVEHRRIDAFELWCWRRLLRVPWTARRSNQFILMEIRSWIFFGRTDAEAEAPILWPPDAKNWLIRKWCWERLKAGGEGDYRGWDGWMGSLTRWTWVWVNSGSWWWTGKPGMLQSMGLQRVGMTEWLNWTELNWLFQGGCLIFVSIYSWPLEVSL